MVQKNCLTTGKILIICGPTASGKSSLAVECAKFLGTEIISADSMNVYKGLDIGTAKPTLAERQNIVHHLIDVVEPRQNFSVGDYREIAVPVVDKLIACGKIPIICGGTGFYINSILYDLSYGNGACNIQIRKKYRNLALQYGNEYVYNILNQIDPESAKKIHPNDTKRVIRALEISENGIVKSKLNDSMMSRYNYLAIAYDIDREELYKRIDIRVDEMIKNGLEQEVLNLKNQGITKDFQCMQGIGYKEMYDYTEGEIDIETAIARIKLNTHHYAKRQITFFKKIPNIQYISYDKNIKIIAKRVVEKL